MDDTSRELYTPAELYEIGYSDGRAGYSSSLIEGVYDSYHAGYVDGSGDLALQAEQAVVRPVDPLYPVLGNPPEGFVFTGEKRVPQANEWYLSKNGNATYLDRPRRNNQTRHILKPK